MIGHPALDAPWAGSTFTPALSLSIGHVEQLLVERLRDFPAWAKSTTEPALIAAANALAQVPVDHFPDRAVKFRLTHPVGQVLVTHYGSRAAHENPEIVDDVATERVLLWDIALLARDLGWAYGGQPSGPSPGAYGLMDAVRLALTGFQIPGFTKMIWVTEDPRPIDEGVYIWVARYAHRCVLVQRDVMPDYPTWVRTQIFERAGVTAVSVPASPYTFDGTGAIQLPDGNLSAVTITDPDSGATFIEGMDYTVDVVNGLVLAAPGGALAAGSTVDVAFSHSEITTAVYPGGSAPTAPTN